MNKRILVTGGSGYKGHVLVPKLLEKGYKVLVLDTFWFGNYLTPNKNLKCINFDIRNISEFNFDDIDSIIHLASIANDPCGDLNPKLTWEVSALATMKLIEKAIKYKVKNFIYASSGSVYGIKEEEKVTEDLELTPISEYNKSKMIAERVLLSYADEINLTILRPATVCGLSKRMRLDVSVNLLTMSALSKGIITVLGGSQIRPNVHIEDICDSYLFFLDNPNYNGIYNIGFENISILDIAKKIQNKLGSKIEIKDNNDDPRSYRLSSEKILKIGFKPKKNVENAIDEIILAYKNNKLYDQEKNYNLKWMKKNNFI